MKKITSSLKKQNHQSIANHRGFTLVELIVVIVIIGIIATITFISYTGISSRAVASSLQSDLNNGANRLKMYYVDNGSYPTGMTDVGSGNYCPTPTDTRYCIKASLDNTFNYPPFTPGSKPQTFTLEATTSATTYRITNDTSPVVVVAASCPSGFIPVPGSATYSTSDFCVMKYEAKNAGGNVPVSQAAGVPWASITQNNAIAYSPNVADCTGCHLITEAEWLTIAQNVLQVTSNWSTGTVGSGFIYSGHNDAAPNSPLAADSSDANGYAGETNTGGNQRRTLNLSNGEVVWDMAGNLWEWTSTQKTGGQPGISGEPSFAWKEWTAVNVPGTRSPNPSPSTTGISGASTWNSVTNGIGSIYSYSGDAVLRGTARGAGWTIGSDAGILTLRLDYQPVSSSAYVGFRVAQ